MDVEEFWVFVNSIVNDHASAMHGDFVIYGENDLDTVTNKIVEKAKEVFLGKENCND